MKEILQGKYEQICKNLKLEISKNEDNINSIIKKSIINFINECKNPAIWCYGIHTQMLMSDFMFELKKVHYVIDKKIRKKTADSGFEIIFPNEISEKQIDGIIISSQKYRDEIIKDIKTNYNSIKYLDIYTELEKAGIHLEISYFSANHPYSRYCMLNKMQRSLYKGKNRNDCISTLKEIIATYIGMKDFKSAIVYTNELTKRSDKLWVHVLLEQLKDLYDLQVESFKKIHENNVVMLCIDGLRRKDVTEGYMNKLYDFIKETMCYYSNAYSVSTSTYESLIPAYCENDDLRTKYYEVNKVPSDNCRFVNEAKKQNRKIFFYTDGIDYIEDSLIEVKIPSQTATEKLWDFLLDAIDEKNGFFYIHILYESHYSYPNPYTTDDIVAEGTNIMFDYLDKNGGQIRTDYHKQHKEALKYLDDIIVPFIQNLKCRMVLYADHGNILIDEGTSLEKIEKTKYTFHEDLIQVPFAVKSPETGIKRNDSLISIMELNHVLIELMNKRNVLLGEKKFIKVVRSEIYNPDFKYLYKKANNSHGLLAFEVFIFQDGYKLAIYSDGIVELYLTETDFEIYDLPKKKELLSIVKDIITVCNEIKI